MGGKSRKGINGKQKGARYERHLAKVFTEWARGQGHVCEIRRTPLSGGWSRSHEMGMTADIVASCSSFPYSVEAKNRQEWSLRALTARAAARKPGTGPVWKYWKQCVTATPPSKVSLLVLSRIERGKQIPDLAVLPLDAYVATCEGHPLDREAQEIYDPHGTPLVLVPLANLLRVATWAAPCESEQEKS